MSDLTSGRILHLRVKLPSYFLFYTWPTKWLICFHKTDVLIYLINCLQLRCSRY